MLSINAIMLYLCLQLQGMHCFASCFLKFQRISVAGDHLSQITVGVPDLHCLAYMETLNYTPRMWLLHAYLALAGSVIDM